MPNPSSCTCSEVHARAICEEVGERLRIWLDQSQTPANRKPAPILEAACWSHGRRKFFDLAKSGKAPIATEAVRRIDELFEIERAVNGQTPEQRLAARHEKSRPLVIDLEIRMRQQRALLSSSNDTARRSTISSTAGRRWPASSTTVVFVCRTMRRNEPCAVWRWEERIGPSPVQMLAAIAPPPCKMNDVDPQAWLADVLARLPDYPASKVADLLLWNWKANLEPKAAVPERSSAEDHAYLGCWPGAYKTNCRWSRFTGTVADSRLKA
jgi:transposase